jgi:adenylosuccinate synthase
VSTLLKQLGLVTAVIGAQWGDEGKGKIVDILTEHFDVLARASGGANAGHTVVIDGEKHVFHLLPSGCLHEGKPVILGSGMVIHLPTLLGELNTLKEAGIDLLPRLHISQAAHIVFDYHKKIDGVIEERRLGGAIGTTKRGIGPAYAEKAFRTGMRMQDLAGKDMKDIQRVFEHDASFIHKMFDIKVLAKEELKQIAEAKKLLSARVTDTVALIHLWMRKKKSILIEGAQATLLDIDHGTYPYVTSSATTVMGALQGLGLPPSALTSCIGIVKAYCTRVGDGPFATEITGKRGDSLRERGGEYGATTGRPRRCGWLDLNDLTRAIWINGFTHLNLTKLDVLDAEKDIPIVSVVKTRESASLRPGMTSLPGWQQSTKGLTTFKDLPENAQRYVHFIEEQTNIPVSFIGTGPGREEMILR